MATYLLPLLNWATEVDGSGNVWWEPGSVERTNKFFADGAYRFKNAGSSKIKLSGRQRVPPNYNASGTTLIVVEWTAKATSNNIVWGLEYRSVGGDDTTSLDQSTAVETVSVTDAAPGAIWRQLATTLSLTASNIAAGDKLQFNFYRDKSSGSDTLTDDGFLTGLYLQYTD